MKTKTIGAWRSDFNGYEAIIIILSKDDDYFANIYLFNVNVGPKTEKLIKKDNYFYVENSNEEEYYLIKDDAFLEIGDKFGILCNALNISPGSDIKELPDLSIKNTIGQDVRFVSGMYSKSPPKTLPGTNNEIWIVYFEDINTTFKVDKATNKIISFVSGLIPVDANKLFTNTPSLN